MLCAVTFSVNKRALCAFSLPQDFLTRLVCNLLEEGNAFFRDQHWEEAVRQFSEALNISSYAKGEEIEIPQALLESLYVNRAAAYQSMVSFFFFFL